MSWGVLPPVFFINITLHFFTQIWFPHLRHQLIRGWETMEKMKKTNAKSMSNFYNEQMINRLLRTENEEREDHLLQRTLSPNSYSSHMKKKDAVLQKFFSRVRITWKESTADWWAKLLIWYTIRPDMNSRRGNTFRESKEKEEQTVREKSQKCLPKS